MAVVAVAAAALALALAAQSGKVSWLGGPRKGSALNADAVVFYGSKNLAPNQRFVMMFNDILNRSDETVLIRSIDPISLPDPDVARLERIEVVLSTPSHPAGSQAIYESYPPAARSASDGSACSYATVSSPNGFELPPSDAGRTAAFMVIIVRTVRPGETDFEVGRVVYELDGRTYEQDVRMRFELGVKPGGRRVVKDTSKIACPEDKYLVPQPPDPPPSPATAR